MDKNSREQTKAEGKKLIKQKKLYDAAYELFTTKGVNKTSIDDIAKKAGVAKGTFYLYFQDKHDIIDRIVWHKSLVLLNEAMNKTEKEAPKLDTSFVDRMITFTGYVIEYLKENKRLLELINKNLSWGVFRNALRDPRNHDRMEEVRSFFLDNNKPINMDSDTLEKVVFMIIELVSSVCYSSIILNEPDNIDNMKPLLFNMIKKMLL
ncbi:TetR family transcriptional regulator [Clostridium bovifaecis]|uniref:TetR family transcriptional regulator n=1 Tax=Clostridium bovifaecis TaxID=2184719 RepID=A0A6I6F1C8_9CLOT|nr:TetR family transcriptional regulator [Clostridium bovifaecis]